MGAAEESTFEPGEAATVVSTVVVVAQVTTTIGHLRPGWAYNVSARASNDSEYMSLWG